VRAVLHAVRRIAATGQRIRAAGGAVRTRVRDRSRAAGKRAHAIASKLRSRAALGREEAKAAVLTSTGELAGLAQTACRFAFFVSSRGPLTCDDAGRLTRCHRALVSEQTSTSDSALAQAACAAAPVPRASAQELPGDHGVTDIAVPDYIRQFDSAAEGNGSIGLCSRLRPDPIARSLSGQRQPASAQGRNEIERYDARDVRASPCLYAKSWCCTVSVSQV
jgi:hypothetical protein